MRVAAKTLRRIALATWAALLSFFAFLAAGPLSPVGKAAADDGGLGAGGAAFAFSYVNWVSIILVFILGFAIRDALQRYNLRAQARRRAKPATPRS